MAFATVDDLAVHLDETIPAGDARATLALDMATAAIRAYTRQRLEAVDNDAVTLRGFGRRLLSLPELPVRNVDSVTLGGTLLDPAEYTWDEFGLLRRPGMATWGTTEAVVVVNDHGYVEIPEPLRAVTIQAAGRAYSNPGGILQEGIGSYQVTYAKVSSVELLPGEMRVLDTYRHRGLA